MSKQEDATVSKSETSISEKFRELELISGYRVRILAYREWVETVKAIDPSFDDQSTDTEKYWESTDFKVGWGQASDWLDHSSPPTYTHGAFVCYAGAVVNESNQVCIFHFIPTSTNESLEQFKNIPIVGGLVYCNPNYSKKRYEKLYTKDLGLIPINSWNDPNISLVKKNNCSFNLLFNPSQAEFLISFNF